LPADLMLFAPIERDLPQRFGAEFKPSRLDLVSSKGVLNSLRVDERAKVQFPFTPQKKAVAANFARTGGPGGNPVMHPHPRAIRATSR